MLNIAYQGDYLIGVDEAGRGPLAGPVIAAAVMLDKDKPIFGLDDSKKLSVKQRERLFDEIVHKSKSYGIGRAEANEIDQINILKATLLAMKRAITSLTIQGEYVVVDGNMLPLISLPSQAIIGGDGFVPEISAASILAKVTRDREMYQLDKKFPGYGFAKHKGYPTKAHRDALQTLGVCSIHRKTFAPVKECVQLKVKRKREFILA